MQSLRPVKRDTGKAQVNSRVNTWNTAAPLYSFSSFSADVLQWQLLSYPGQFEAVTAEPPQSLTVIPQCAAASPCQVPSASHVAVKHLVCPWIVPEWSASRGRKKFIFCGFICGKAAYFSYSFRNIFQPAVAVKLREQLRKGQVDLIKIVCIFRHIVQQRNIPAESKQSL